jgi:tetratricopeptide (TPR) repeat protein
MYQDLESDAQNEVKIAGLESKISLLIDESSAEDDLLNLGLAYRYLALLNIIKNDKSSFLSLIKKSTDYFTRIDATQDIIKNKLNCGNFYLQNEAFDKYGDNCFSTLYDALDLSLELKDNDLTVSSYFYLGYMYQSKFEEYSEAINCYSKALQLYEANPVDFPAWKIYNNICNCYIVSDRKVEI